MDYATALEIGVRHTYWGDASAPFSVRAADPTIMRRVGLIMRSGGSGAVVAAPVGADGMPDRLAFDVLAEDVQQISLTEGWQADSVPIFAPDPLTEAGVDGTNCTIRPTDESQSELPRLPGDRRLCQISLPLSAAQFPIRCTVSCDTVQALWAYHIVGKSGADPIHIVDEAAEILFDDLGEETLPNGRIARILRSNTPVPLRWRNAIRLSLKEDQPPPYDPETLIPVLPVGGPNLKPVAGATPTDILQSDIYVSL